MPACRGVTANDQLSLARTARLLLVFLLQSFVVLLAGFAALLLDFEPSWSAEGPQGALIRPGEAHSGSLLLKSDDGTTAAPRLGRSVVRFDASGIDPMRDGYQPVLSTCWPFDALTAGAERQLLHATMIDPGADRLAANRRVRDPSCVH